MTGTTVGHYRVLERIGAGGMGTVYRAEDIRLGRTVALKFLSDELSGSASAVSRFEREARAASALSHPNICAIHDVGQHEGRPFLVMELLEAAYEERYNRLAYLRLEPVWEGLRADPRFAALAERIGLPAAVVAADRSARP
jgi:serine/threonine protein kinase